MTVEGGTRVFCVLGHPVGHSLSPAMQNAALRAMGIDGVYVAFDVRPEGLGDAIRGLRALGVAGANCTIPHKEAVLHWVDELAPEAAFVGAVNTLVLKEDRWIGHNTDAAGFLADLREQGADLTPACAVVLGAGGAARAVVAALAREGWRVILANRTAARAEELAAEFDRKLGRNAVEAIPMEPEALREAVRGASLLVNTTSLGMSPHPEGMPPVPLESLGPHLFVYDLIYNPLETRLLREARKRGARAQHGAGMLAHQGALALELWTGRPAPAALMRRVILERLGAGPHPAPVTAAAHP